MIGICTRHFTIANDDENQFVYPSINGCKFEFSLDFMYACIAVIKADE